MNNTMKQLAMATYYARNAETNSHDEANYNFFNGLAIGIANTVDELTGDRPIVLIDKNTVDVLHGDATYRFDAYEL